MTTRAITPEETQVVQTLLERARSDVLTLLGIDQRKGYEQEKYFRSFFVLAKPFGDVPIPVFPGGYLIGGLLLINLIAAHVYRFAFSWR